MTLHMRFPALAFAVLLVTGCGGEIPRSPWPAHIASMEGMSEEEQAEVRKAVDELNALAETTVVTFEPSAANYGIVVKKNDPSQDVENRAGFALVSPQNCNIDLSSVIFNSDKTEYIRPVIFHELGHCAGMNHSEDESDIMFKATVPNSSYTEEAISKFTKAFRAAAGL